MNIDEWLKDAINKVKYSNPDEIVSNLEKYGILEPVPTEPKKILVIYPDSIREGINSEGYRFSARLKTFMFLSENSRFIDCISGTRLCGLIIQDGVNNVTHRDFEFFLTRLWYCPPSIMLMSQTQAGMLVEVCHNILQEKLSYGYDVKELREKLLRVCLSITTHP